MSLTRKAVLRMLYGMNTRIAVDDIAADLPAGLLDTRQAAELLGLSPRCLEDWRLRGTGPRFIRLSAKCVKYRPRELARFIAEREVQSTSEPTPASSNSSHRANRDRGGGRGRG